MNEKTEIDKALAVDISQAISTWRSVYIKGKPIRDNYSRKIKKGIFDKQLAVKGMMHIVERTLKSHEFKMLYADIWPNKATRLEISRFLLDHWMEEIEENATE